MGSPHHNSTLKISEFNANLGAGDSIVGTQKQLEEDTVLRDLQASIQAENEIREILNKNRKHKIFKPPILFNNNT